MKIGINASFARKKNTGIGQVSVNFLEKLAEKIKNYESGIGKDTEFILYLEKDLDFKLPDNFKKRIFLPLYKRDDLIRKIWWERYLLPKKIKEDKCDVFLSLYQCPTILKHSFFKKGREGEGFSKILLKSPFTKGETMHVMLVHDIIPKLFPEYLDNFRKKLYWKLTEKAIKEADEIIAVSESTKKDLIQHLNISPEKISVSYVDVDEIYKKEVPLEKSQEVLEKYGLKSGYIYSGGGMEKRKNIGGLLRAYRLLLDENKEAIPALPPLVISGKLMPKMAPLITDAEKLVKDLRLRDRVKLLNLVPQKDLPALYKNALFFVYPSFYEGFGLPVLEAMNCGTPVIASGSSSLPEVSGDAILYCDPKNIEDIAEKMEKILIDSNLQKELSEKGKERAKNFSWERFVKKMEKYFLQ